MQYMLKVHKCALLEINQVLLSVYIKKKIPADYLAQGLFCYYFAIIFKCVSLVNSNHSHKFNFLLNLRCCLFLSITVSFTTQKYTR